MRVIAVSFLLLTAAVSLSAMSVTSVDPPNLPTRGGVVTIHGSGFQPPPDACHQFCSTIGVKADGVAAPSVRYESELLLTVTLPPHVGGTVDLTVLQGNEARTIPFTFTEERPTTSPLTLIVPVAGSVAGGHGSLFHTEMQVTNAGADTDVWFYFRPASVVAAQLPAIHVPLAPLEAVFFSDVARQFGQSGIGSIEIRTLSSGLRVHAVIAEAQGFSGAVEAVPVATLLGCPPRPIVCSSLDVVLLSGDVFGQRINVGVRALDPGAVVHFVRRNRSGLVIAEQTRTYGPNEWVQLPLDTVLASSGGRRLSATDVFPQRGGDGTLTVELQDGLAAVWVATTSNSTNDPDIQIARYHAL